MIGKTLAHYEVLEKLGSGGMGEIYRARDTRLNRDVALKVLTARLAMDADLKKRFEGEAQTVAALKHPGIVTIYSVEEVEGTSFLTMELVEGRTLADRLADGRPHVEELCDILLPLADALGAAHAKGIVHRDIKPANVMLTQGGVKLLDFGVAKLSQETLPQGALTEVATQAGAVLGTPAYMSPEQLRGEPVDARSDLFSLGVLMYELTTGRHPFPGENAAETISSILRDTPPPCTEAQGPGIEGLITILDRCLEKDPTARYQTAVELREDLGRMKDHAGQTPASSGQLPRATDQDALVRGRAAITKHAWSEAYQFLTRADTEGHLEPEDLKLLAEAAWWIGNIDDSMGVLERAYKLFLDRGQNTAAGRVATTLAEEYHATKKAKSVASGWTKRADRLLEEDSLERGYLNRLLAKHARADDWERALELSKACIETARRFNDPDLEALGLMDQAYVLVSMGEVETGMGLVDEAMGAAVSGELSPLVTGKVYCIMMSVCEHIADYRRASEWSEVAVKWCEPHGDSIYPGICQVHRAELSRLRGNWNEAEKQALLASEHLRYYSGLAAEAHYELGEIQLRRGDLKRAEKAFRKAHELGRDPVPGLALLRLAEGNVRAAQELLDRALSEITTPLDRAQLLPARIEISVHANDAKKATALIQELEETAKKYGVRVYEAAGKHGRGLVSLQQGKTDQAVQELQTARKTWSELDLPYQSAQTRVLLGKAYAALGNREAADLELGSAIQVFQQLGARRDLQIAEALIARK